MQSIFNTFKARKSASASSGYIPCVIRKSIRLCLMSSFSSDEDNGLNTPLGNEYLLLKSFPDIFKTVNLVRLMNDAEFSVFSKLLLISRYVRFLIFLKCPGFIVLIKLSEKIRCVVEIEKFIEADVSFRCEQFVHNCPFHFL